VARNWKRLAHFYETVLGCVPVPPERDHSGRWLEQVTGVPGARIRGMHMRLPGCGEDGPTLEIFQYDEPPERPPTAVNRPGLAHIAFAVEDVEEAREAVLAAGGHTVGETVTRHTPGLGTITVVYVTDPEGNVIELQRWTATP
jgi:catechol 2,3-dioxygenase-like lactoylglutathione lyase family enzyme